MVNIQVESYKQWRTQARELLYRQIPPEDVHWQVDQQSNLLFSEDNSDFLELPIKQKTISIPKAFLELAKPVCHHRDNRCWGLLYSIAWRLIFEDKHLLNFDIDPQIAKAMSMRKSIGRDIHKMEAFVRFRKTPCASSPEKDYFIAWFEPEHYIVPLVVSFFTRRFSNMHWSILTPDRCLHWDTKKAWQSEGVTRPEGLHDELEELWKAYYKNIFNPARLKLKAMQSEMPKKYWVNLPEAPLIGELTRQSMFRTEKMMTNTSSEINNRKLKLK